MYLQHRWNDSLDGFADNLKRKCVILSDGMCSNKSKNRHNFVQDFFLQNIAYYREQISA